MLRRAVDTRYRWHSCISGPGDTRLGKSWRVSRDRNSVAAIDTDMQ
jgi:hypothetical protein